MKPNSLRFIIGLVFILINVNLLEAATTYKWRDKDGNTVYSQHPPNQGDYETLDSARRHTYSRPDNSPAPATRAAAESIDKATTAQKKQAGVAAEDKKNQDMRNQTCEAAKKQLQAFTVYRRMKDKDGNVTTINDEERQQRIDQAKQAIQDYCN